MDLFRKTRHEDVTLDAREALLQEHGSKKGKGKEVGKRVVGGYFAPFPFMDFAYYTT